MGKASRRKAERKHMEHGWVVDLAWKGHGYPAGRRWFNTDQARVQPPALRRFLYIVKDDPRIEAVSIRPVSRERRARHEL